MMPQIKHQAPPPPPSAHNERYRASMDRESKPGADRNTVAGEEVDMGAHRHPSSQKYIFPRYKGAYTEHNDDDGRRSHAMSQNESQPSKPVDILYEIRCMESNRLDKSFFQETPFMGTESTDLHDYHQTSVLDVFVDVTGIDRTGKRGQSRATYVANADSREHEPFKLGEDFIVSRLTTPGMYIWSHCIQEMLRGVVEYYPSQILTGQRVFICHPYPVLHHYYSEMIDVMEYCNGKVKAAWTGGQSPRLLRDGGEESENEEHRAWRPKAKEGVEPDYQTMAHDIGVLINFLTPDHESIIEPELQRYARGVATYKMIWLLLKPGTDVYAKSSKERALAGFVVMSVEEEKKSSSSSYPIRTQWKVEIWNLAYFGNNVFRQSQTFYIEEFKGEREITSLRVFPSSYHDANDSGLLRQKLEARGKKYFEAVRNVPNHVAYSGYILNIGTKKQYHGEIIIDPKNYVNATYAHIAQNKYESDEEEEEEDIFEVELSDSNAAEKWISYDKLDPKKHPSLSKHHYFLFTRQIHGFALKEKDWMTFDIECVHNLVWQNPGDAMSHLVLPRRDLEIIQSLSRGYGKDRISMWGADFIRGKGEGQVFLLHGPPGTGKTYTVECVAQFTRRPLLTLTVADIGMAETRTEAHLSKWFALAADWGAVLLLDEADVFLERRRTSDLTRNSLVSVFLRTMEYYSGMLFLTTNRIGQIDDAFLSRVQVALGYEKLDDHARERIWYGFFEKLKRDRKDVIVTERAKRFVTDDPVLKAMKWNGREIRNALQTAVALARSDADKLKESGEASTTIEVTRDHLEQVVERRKVFVDYTNSIRRETEEQRALGEGNRRDRDL